MMVMKAITCSSRLTVALPISLAPLPSVDGSELAWSLSLAVRSYRSFSSANCLLSSAQFSKSVT